MSHNSRVARPIASKSQKITHNARKPSTRQLTTTKTKNKPKKQPQQRSRSPFSTSAATATTTTTTTTTNITPSSLDQIPTGVVLPNITKASDAINSTPQISTLSNGIKVITMDSAYPITHLQIRVNVGSMYEDAKNLELGKTFFVARLMDEFAGALNQTLPNATRLGVESSRESLNIRAATIGDISPALIEMSKLVHDESPWAIPTAIKQLKQIYSEDLLEQHRLNPSERFDDDIHRAAFRGHGLGNPTFPHPESLPAINTTSLTRWHNQFFTANRLTIGAMGIQNHNEFVQQCEQLFGQIQTDNHSYPCEITSAQRDGEPIQFNRFHRHIMSQELLEVKNIPPNHPQHVSIAWHGPELKSPFLVPMTVLQTVIGRASTFSSGGPGKGMYARASTHLIAPRPYVFEVASFTANYQPGSLFGINAIVEGNKTNQFINEMLNELQSIATTITDEEVYRAKQQLRRQLLSHYENAELLLTELVSSVNNFGKWKGPDYLHDIDKVSTAQVQQCAELLFDPAVALITTIGNPRQVSHQWYSREPDDPDQTPFTEQTLNAHLDSVYKPTKKTALDGLKALFRR